MIDRLHEIFADTTIIYIRLISCFLFVSFSHFLPSTLLSPICTTIDFFFFCLCFSFCFKYSGYFIFPLTVTLSSHFFKSLVSLLLIYFVVLYSLCVFDFLFFYFLFFDFFLLVCFLVFFLFMCRSIQWTDAHCYEIRACALVYHNTFYDNKFSRKRN